MSVLLVDSFDDRQSTDLSRKAINDFDDGLIIVGAGVCGTNCFNDVSIGDGIWYGANFTESATVQVGIALNPFSSVAGISQFISVQNIHHANAKAFLLYDVSDGSIEVWIGNNVALGVMFFKSAPGLQPPSTYVYHELRVLFDDTVGQIDYWADGVSKFSTTGVDTIEDTFGGSGPWKIVQLNTNGPQCLDDLYIMNGDGTAPTNATVSIGPAHVVALLPQQGAQGIGSLNEMTPSTGTDRGALMNENPPNYDVDYLFANGEGERQLFRFPLIAGIVSDTVYAVQKEVFARMDDIGHGEVSLLTQSPAAVLTETGRWGLATQQVSTDVPQTSNYHYYLQCDDRQGDASPWSIIDVNASQFGMRHYESFS